MDFDLSEFVQKEQAAGAKPLTTGFTKEKRVGFTESNLAKGDYFVIPEDFKKYTFSTQIRGSENTAEYLLIPVTTKNGTKRVKRFYPGSLGKVVQVVDPKTFQFVGTEEASGAVCDDYRNFDGNVNETIDYIRKKCGNKKVIMITDVKLISTLGNEGRRTTSVLTAEYVDKPTAPDAN